MILINQVVQVFGWPQCVVLPYAGIPPKSPLSRGSSLASVALEVNPVKRNNHFLKLKIHDSSPSPNNVVVAIPLDVLHRDSFAK